jgi:hypothetical protein
MRWAQVECDCDFKLQFCAQMTEALRSTIPRWEFATAPLLSALPLVRVRDRMLLGVYFRTDRRRISGVKSRSRTDE